MQTKTYQGRQLDRVAFPLGGLGAGMFCLDGCGTLSHMSIHHRPQVFHEPYMYAALHTHSKEGTVSRRCSGPMPDWKVFFPWGQGIDSAGNGGHQSKYYGLPAFTEAAFHSEFPFGHVQLSDAAMPVAVEITGWSPFIPGNSDDSSLPTAALEYTLTNTSDHPVHTVFSFHSKNFMTDDPARGRVSRSQQGFILEKPPTEDSDPSAGAFGVSCSHPNTAVDAAWFRGDWYDAYTLLWRHIETGEVLDQPAPEEGAPSPGGSLYIPVDLEPGESTTLPLRFCWYVPRSTDRFCCVPEEKQNTPKTYYQPWYSRRFTDIHAVSTFWQQQYDRLRAETDTFTRCFYDTSLPPEIIEAVAANLSILKSPTILRQHDGRLWAYEGCSDDGGCCAGSCTHVWNYAQAIPHLFPELERGLRETEFGENQNDQGHQVFRGPLPTETVPPEGHDCGIAADGQLGGLMKLYREWRISGDDGWLERLWPAAKTALQYCIEHFDPDGKGVVSEPHHNTYDIEFWGPDGLCTSFYIGALEAAIQMGSALGEDVEQYRHLRDLGRAYMEQQLFNGEFCIQQIQTDELHAESPEKMTSRNLSEEELALIKKEGPKYQYGKGCLTDGVLGTWMARVCGLPDILSEEVVTSHLDSVYKYNFKTSLAAFANPQRPGYACGSEGGVLMCTWPHGHALTLPFPYSNEVWTGCEYHLAAHLIMLGSPERGLNIVRTLRQRYDGTVRNPYNEYECGSWYARALSSYSLLQAVSGAVYDARTQTLTLTPPEDGDFRAFLSTAAGYGTVGVKNGQPFYEPASGSLDIKEIKYKPAC